jgi:Cu+-exporting ATPase
MKDPVCGMEVDQAKAAGTSDYQGQTYYFCSKGCKGRFDANPLQYVIPSAGLVTSEIVSTPSHEYTCPMDPEIRQAGPGACPKCGMALEPVVAVPLTKTD